MTGLLTDLDSDAAPFWVDTWFFFRVLGAEKNELADAELGPASD